jgi:hypothetical protein
VRPDIEAIGDNLANEARWFPFGEMREKILKLIDYIYELEQKQGMAADEAWHKLMSEPIEYIGLDEDFHHIKYDRGDSSVGIPAGWEQID